MFPEIRRKDLPELYITTINGRETNLVVVEFEEDPVKWGRDDIRGPFYHFHFQNPVSGKLIGYAILTGITGDDIELLEFAIYEDHQNKHWGSNILDYIVNGMNIRKVKILDDNEKAIHLYRKAGFGVTRQKDGYIEMLRM